MMLPPSPTRSLHQLIDQDGKPCTATATGTVCVGYDKQQFAEGVTSGNHVTPYITGKAYYADLIKDLKAATEEILITGWQVNWDALLAPGVRLFDVLLEVAKKGTVNIYVMPWNDTAPIQTFDDQTRSVLLMINDLVPKKVVHVLLAKALADESPTFFSHHQKQVVIDRSIAFVGGIDLAYGRFDDATYDLQADAEGREVLNRYNGCIAQVGKVAPDTTIDPDLLTGLGDRMSVFEDSNRTITKNKIQAKTWQTPYENDTVAYEKGRVNLGLKHITLDPATQPRMPWRDVHARIDGPAVADLTRNFIGRWNGQGGAPKLKPAKPASAYPAGTGSCQIQVLRSAPKNLRDAEYKKLSSEEKNRFAKPSMAQNDIVRVMTKLILKADHFVYIENQFFVSAFGRPQGFDANVGLSGPARLSSTVSGGFDQTTEAYISTTRVAGDHTTATELPENPICATLAQRIDIAIRSKNTPPFHAIITLPVYSEGALNSGAVMTQIHWTMQSLVYGSQSLLNRIRRSLKAQQLRDKKEADPERALRDDNREYEDIPIKDCFKYVTLLNLRNWKQLGNRYVTEQIYVHSKAMIVDDRFALLGSANINDRSLLGTRDSELAVLIIDHNVAHKDTCGDGKARPIRNFAYQLRRELWRAMFGLTGNVRPATALESAVNHPGAPASWKAIQKVAMANAKLYEAAFDFVPRNKDPNNKDIDIDLPASIWPIWNTAKDPKEAKKKPMPFEAAFWKAPQHNPAAAKLTQVTGFITALPIEWTKGENNNFGYHMALVAHNDAPKTVLPEKQQDTEVLAQQSIPVRDASPGEAT